MKKSQVFGMIWVVIPAILILGCRDEQNPLTTKLDDIVFPDSSISYQRQLQPLFNIGCALSSCHDSYTRSSNLELTSYETLKLRFTDVVIAKDTLMSRLIWVVEGKMGSPDLFRYHVLKLNHTKGIRQWILEGARNTP